jgi:hypothetical protein
MITFGQQNYPKLYLGNTRFSFARYGCLSACVVMTYDWLNGKNKTPDQIVPQLEYNSDGMLLWYSVKNINLELKEQVRKNPKLARTVIDKWWPNQSVCAALEVNNGVHFVWQVGRWYPFLGYKIFDPWTNKFTYLKNPTGVRIIGKP